MNTHPSTMPRLAAITSATMLLVMTVLAMLSLLTWLPVIFDAQDPVQTLANFSVNPPLLSQFVYAVTLIIVLDIALGFSLYKLFPHSVLSVVMGGTRVIYSALFFAALLPLWQLLLTHEANNMLPAAADLQAGFVSFNYVWSISLAVFGLHLVLLGRLFCRRAGWAAKTLAGACTLAGVAYMVDGTTLWLLPSLATSLADYVGWGELVVMIYLFAVGFWPVKKSA
ncbi:DUF4386 domain-containing protein [Salinibius halmophilus]|uniref:DUF4386 domain-containing protein n=1 Tax=Salinibius halmophilus TaxID=1853216 RepID=UPI000E66BC5E|nr:DUF4386 domain-containing protein [Salinibius halmophilus]